MMARRISLLALSVAMTSAACDRPEQVALPAGPQVVEVEMTDFAFRYDVSIASGRVLFRVANRGKSHHNLSLIPLSDDIPPIDQQLRGTERRAITPLATIKARPPGTRTSFAAELAPGVRYAMVCFVDDAHGSHALRGMSSEFRTSGAHAGPYRSKSTPNGLPPVVGAVSHSEKNIAIFR